MHLEEYRAVTSGKKLPSYLRAQRTRIALAGFADWDDTALWDIHKQVLTERSLRHAKLDSASNDETLNRVQGDVASGVCQDPNMSLLDLKIELAERMLRNCVLCERRCGADRISGETGFCGVGADSRVFFEQILWGEEAPVIPSHEVFFSGCNMRCRFCYSWEAVLDPSRGRAMCPPELARMFDGRRDEGAANVNLIGGEPTLHLPNILKALRLAERPTAVVWNSNFYMSEDTMSLLDGVVDLYLADFKFGNDTCADAVANTTRYVETITRNIALAAKSANVIIRHLVMPVHIDCCLTPVAEWVSRHLPDKPFNLMFQYTPFHYALDDSILGRSVSMEEEEQARSVVESYGLNTEKWNRPLEMEATAAPAGRGEIEATITIGPDGRVGITRLHRELLDLAQALRNEGENHGGSE